jgi:hypothetical protein
VDAEGKLVVPIGVLQARKWERVKRLRLEKENGTAPSELGPIQIDEASKAKIQGVLGMARLAEEVGMAFSEQFTLADNTVIELNSVKVRKLALAAARQVSKVYTHSRVLRQAIYAAQDAEALGAIDEEAGWP